MASVFSTTFEFIRNFSSDVTILAIIVAVFVAYGFFKGEKRLGSLILSLNIGTLLFALFPYAPKINPSGNFYIRLGIFAVLVFVCELLLKKILSSSYSYSTLKSWLTIGLMSIANAGLIIVIGYHFLGFATLYKPLFVSLQFISSQFLFFWTIIVSLGILYFAKR